jgi:hypothetical protein
MKALALDVDSLPHLDAVGFTDADLQSALARTHLIRDRVELVPGLDLVWSISLDHRTVAVEVQAGGLAVFRVLAVSVREQAVDATYTPRLAWADDVDSMRPAIG